MNFSEKELKRLEKKAKDVRFRCKRYCGIEFLVYIRPQDQILVSKTQGPLKAKIKYLA
jgi:hypothetical protein